MPDISASRSLLYLSQTQAAAKLMSAVARRDECVSLLCAPGGSSAALLDEAENELSSHRFRCVRVYGPSSGKLSLRDLVAQIVDRADPDALTDHDLKAGFTTLTEPGEGYDRVALLVTEAHNLTSSALHYIQLACRSGPKLRVALAGQRALAAVLAQDEFAFLRQRISRTLQLPRPVPGKVPHLLSWARRRWSVPAGFRRGGSRTLLRLGVVAASVLLIAAVGLRHGPAPSDAALRADGSVPGDQAVLIRAEPAAVQQESAAAAGKQAEEAALPEPGVMETPTLETADAPPGPPVKPAGDDAAPEASPASAASGRPPEPTPDAAPALPAPAVASVPVLPSSPASAVTVPPPDPSPPRRPRGGAEQAVPPMAALPARFTDGRRCRDIVLHAQSGKDLSDADQLFLRHDCRAK